MTRQYKKWEDHSFRWQRDAQREGLTSKRWNGWLKLSDKTRKDSDPRKYAAGKSIAGQRRERKEEAAVKKLRSTNPQKARTTSIQRNVKKMTDKDLDWTLKASVKQIRQRASQKHVPGYVHNPWWYL